MNVIFIILFAWISNIYLTVEIVPTLYLRTTFFKRILEMFLHFIASALRMLKLSSDHDQLVKPHITFWCQNCSIFRTQCPLTLVTTCQLKWKARSESFQKEDVELRTRWRAAWPPPPVSDDYIAFKGFTSCTTKGNWGAATWTVFNASGNTPSTTLLNATVKI